MSAINRTALNALLNSKVITGNNATTAQNLRDYENAGIASFLNLIDDKDVANGYLSIDGFGNANYTLIKKATPTGQFLSDNGTWQTPGSGTFLPLSGGTMTGAINGASSLIFQIGGLSKVSISSTSVFLNSGVNLNVTANINANSFVVSGGTSSQFLKADGTVDSNSYFILPSLSSGSVVFSNGSTLSQNNSNFFWDNSNVLLYIGANSGAYANTKLQINSNTNAFAQVNFVNTNSGASASSDYVATADTGTNTTNYVDLGINSSNFSDVTFTIVGALGSYLYSNGGDMAIGTQSAKKLLFFTNGTLAANKRMDIDSAGLINMGNAAANSTAFGIVRIGQGTSIIDAGQISAAFPGLWFQQSTATATNYTIGADNFDTLLNNANSVQIRFSNIAAVNFTNQATQSATSFVTFLKPTITAQTASTDRRTLTITPQGIQWATGALANHYEVFIDTATLSFVGASTVARSYGLYSNASTAGTNATITQNYSGGFAGGNGLQIQTGSIVNEGVVIRDLVGTPTQSAIYMGETPSATNYALKADASHNTFVNGGQVFLATSANSRVIVNDDKISINNFTAVSSGASTTFNFTKPANTSQTLSTEIPGWKLTGGSRGWATGALALQRENWWTTTTYGAVAASTFTTVYAHYFESVTAGTNMTITNNYVAGFNGGNGIQVQPGSIANQGFLIRDLVGTAAQGAIYVAVTPSATNYLLKSDGSNAFLNAPVSTGSVSLNANNSPFVTMTGVTTSGSQIGFQWVKPNNTNQTTNTAVSGWTYAGGSRAWAGTATITTQKETQWQATTYTAITSSTMTDVFANYFESAIASTNVTITNNWAAGFEGNVKIVSVTTNKKLSVFSTGNKITSIASDSTGGYIGTETNDPFRILIQNGVSTPLTIGANVTTGAVNGFLYALNSNTGQTASTEISGFLYNSYSRQWATGNITTQREQWIKTVTYTAVGASVIANAFAFYAEAPTASTNVTITANWAAGFNGSVKIESGFKLQLGNAAATGLTAGVLAATTNASIVLTDSTGQAYRIPCII